MNRLRVLLKRAHRGECGIARLSDGWYVANENGCDGPMSRREAILAASRWALPRPPIVVRMEGF